MSRPSPWTRTPPRHEAYGDFRLQRLEWDKPPGSSRRPSSTKASAAAYAGAARAYLGQNRPLEATRRSITSAVARTRTMRGTCICRPRRATPSAGRRGKPQVRSGAELKPDLWRRSAPRPGPGYRAAIGKAQRAPRSRPKCLRKGSRRRGRGHRGAGAHARPPRPGTRAYAARACGRIGRPQRPFQAWASAGGARRASGCAQGDGDRAGAARLGRFLGVRIRSLLRRMASPRGRWNRFRKCGQARSKEPATGPARRLLVERGEFEEAEQQLRRRWR